MLKLANQEKMIIIATPGGDEVGLYYRKPTTKEIHQYQSESIQRKRNTVLFRHSEAQYKFGNAILSGIREGDFGVPNDQGEIVAISGDPKNPNYREDWRELVQKFAPEVIIALGAHVFGGTEALDGEEDIQKN